MVNTEVDDRRKRGNRKLCYCCGSNFGVEDDHIPPRSFFPDGDLPGVNLITVPACKECNRRWTTDAESFRAYFCCNQGTSVVGKQIAQKKVFSESGKVHTHYKTLRNSFRKVMFSTPSGPRPGGVFVMEPKIVQRVLVHLTKGLLYKYYPEQWDPSAQFKHRCFSDSSRGLSKFEVETLTGILSRLQHRVVMKDVFEFYSGSLLGQGGDLIWVYGFYSGCWFMVTHSRPKIEKDRV